MAFGNATKGYVKKHSGGGGGGGTSNYNDLSNKPTINGVTLSGNKTSEDLGISGGGGAILHSITHSPGAISGSGTTTINVDISSLNFSDNNYMLVAYDTDYDNAGLIMEIKSRTATTLSVIARNVTSDTMYPAITFYIIKF